jgi:hypothetical protein
MCHTTEAIPEVQCLSHQSVLTHGLSHFLKHRIPHCHLVPSTLKGLLGKESPTHNFEKFSFPLQKHLRKPLITNIRRARGVHIIISSLPQPH